MNRFAQTLAENGHLSFNQKCRHLVLQIFGHEALIDTDDLHENSHCVVLNIDIFHLASLKIQHLAKRKLFNPFKWVEFILVFPVEIVCWSLRRHAALIALKIENKKSSTGKSAIECYLILADLITFPANILAAIALAIPKRILAPVRYIIRPTIEFAKIQPIVFNVTLAIFLLVIAMLAISIFTGGLPLAIGGATFASIILAKTAITAGIGIAVWASLLKFVTGMQEFFDVLKKINHAPYPFEQKTEKFKEHSSTEKITEALHAINPTLTLVNKSDEQNYAQTFALMTGTESIFYKPALILSTISSQDPKTISPHP